MDPLEKLPQLLECDTPETWNTTLLEITKDFGFDQIAFWSKPNKISRREATFVKSTYPDEWLATYDKSKLHAVDPTILHCRKNMLPLAWTPKTFKGKKQKEFYGQACDYGLRSGITYPSHRMSGGFGVLTFATGDIREADPHIEVMASLSLIRDFAFASSAKFFKNTQPNELHLTPRELEILQWVLAGKSSWETGKILRVAESTINFHANNAMDECGVHTRREAALIALQAGLITLG